MGQVSERTNIQIFTHRPLTKEKSLWDEVKQNNKGASSNRGGPGLPKARDDKTSVSTPHRESFKKVTVGKGQESRGKIQGKKSEPRLGGHGRQACREYTGWGELKWKGAERPRGRGNRKKTTTSSGFRSRFPLGGELKGGKYAHEMA